MKEHQRQAVAEVEASSPGQEAAVRARQAVEGEGPVPDRPKLRAGPAGSGGVVRAALEAHGHRLEPTPQGGGLRCALEVAESEDGWLVATAHYVPEKLPAHGQEPVFHRLQRWTTGGRFLLGPAREVRVDVPTPHLGQPPEPLVVWAASQATAMLQVAGRHFGYEAGDA